jgi:hypothetical protein
MRDSFTAVMRATIGAIMAAVATIAAVAGWGSRPCMPAAPGAILPREMYQRQAVAGLVAEGECHAAPSHPWSASISVGHPR